MGRRVCRWHVFTAAGARGVLARLLALLLGVGVMSLAWTATPALAAEGSAAAVVTGGVVDAVTGEGVPDAEVEVYDESTYDWAITGPDGSYTVDLPPGTYEVDVYAEGYHGGHAVVEVTASTTSLPTIELQPLGDPVPVSGSVVDATSGDGIGGAYVELYGPSYADVTTDPDGSFAVELVPGLYDVYVSAGGFDDHYTEVEVTETTTTLEAFELEPLPDMVSVSGSVVDSASGEGIGDAYVEADGDGYDDAFTGEDGSYTLHVPVGSYDLLASADGYDDGQAQVEITESTTSLPPIELDPLLPGIYVTVSDNTFGGPTANADVSVRPQGGGAATVKTTDPDGEVSFTGLSTGTYVVEVLPGNGVNPVDEPMLVEYVDGEFTSVELFAEIDLSCEPDSAHQGLTNMGFENGLAGWTLGYQTESIQAVGADSFTSPWEGSTMARLGQSQPSDNENQPEGPNIMCQDFEVTDPEERFAFNVFTYDYTGFDEFRFDVVVTDPDTGETLAAYEQGAWGEGTELKTSGWRGVQLDLADHVGDTVRLNFRAGGTSDDLYAFWAYVDSAETLPPTIETDVTDVQTETGSVTTDPTTGQITVSMPFGDKSDLTMTVPASCQDPEAEPSSVALLLNGETYAATPAGDGLFTATIPADSIDSGPLSVQVVCPGETTVVVPIGQIVLYDPSGIVSDALSGDPVVGAEVRLFKVPGWTPQGEAGPYPDDSCQTNLSKEPGDPWDQPAPTDEGVLVNAASPEISPNVNPFITNSIGYYGWDVAEGCWYVEVEADGYQALTSPVVGVPTEVTDLDLELQPLAVVNTTKPSISGTAKVGNALTAAPGEWNTDDASFTYQWLRDGNPIDGETGTSYSVVPADVGEALAVEVTATTDGLEPGTATSDAVTGQPGDAPTASPKPAITGTPKVGSTLSASSGTWNLDGVAFAYQWLRDGDPIADATGSTYELVPADVEATLTVEVTATKDGYQDGSATSDAVTGQLGDAPTASPKPSVAGRPTMGNTLTAQDGEWDVAGLSFTYQWLRDGTPIDGATEKQYPITPEDVGTELAVRVTATKEGFHDGEETSAPTDVAAGTISATKPKVTGKTKVGKTLTAKAGTSTPSETTVKYQWLRNGKAIKKATKNKYKLTKKDKGKKISVKVTRTAAGYDKLVLKSAQTKAIKG